jgi:hypothetical protein
MAEFKTHLFFVQKHSYKNTVQNGNIRQEGLTKLWQMYNIDISEEWE